MCDIEIVTKAMEDAQLVLRDYAQLGPREKHAVLQRMLEIMEHEHVVAAQARLLKGYGRLKAVS
ncbi:hypothetical protein [Tardiphaga sp. 841_E9_N1_2]|uniref:hypothetical protein n=1 Tax=unclassified Tardiphaga TaxID=2631404 RepID=UPI003F260ABA